MTSILAFDGKFARRKGTFKSADLPLTRSMQSASVGVGFCFEATCSTMHFRGCIGPIFTGYRLPVHNFCTSVVLLKSKAKTCHLSFRLAECTEVPFTLYQTAEIALVYQTENTTTKGLSPPQLTDNFVAILNQES